MKKIFYVIVFAFTIGFNLNAQDFNTIPYNTQLKSFADGWYQLELEGVQLDVELRAGKYVKGNVTWPDGASYSGGLSGVKLSGKGTYVWSNGHRYEGAFKNHQRHGIGSQIDADGMKWSGKWKGNQKNGKGKVFDPNGMVTQKGVWTANELVARK